MVGELKPGTLLRGKWRLERFLGRGGMSSVYAATHRNGMRGAIKVLHRELNDNTVIKTRFLREGYVANKVDHPGAVKVLDDDATEDGLVFLVMELLEGETLKQRWVKSDRRLELSIALDIADQVLDVLESAHANRIVHRDLKPDNIFLVESGGTKILDFGIARVLEAATPGAADATSSAAMMGTPAFMPPEQALAHWHKVDARSDLFALGATLFTVLTGRLVHTGSTIPELLVAAATKQADSIGVALAGRAHRRRHRSSAPLRHRRALAERARDAARAPSGQDEGSRAWDRQAGADGAAGARDERETERGRRDGRGRLPPAADGGDASDEGRTTSAFGGRLRVDAGPVAGGVSAGARRAPHGSGARRASAATPPLEGRVGDGPRRGRRRAGRPLRRREPHAGLDHHLQSAACWSKLARPQRARGTISIRGRRHERTGRDPRPERVRRADRDPIFAHDRDRTAPDPIDGANRRPRRGAPTATATAARRRAAAAQALRPVRHLRWAQVRALRVSGAHPPRHREDSIADPARGGGVLRWSELDHEP